jgi:predicted DNA-binding protein
MKPTPVLLDQTDRDRLNAEAERLGTSRAAVIRRLIREHLTAPTKGSAQ